jgi:hypothetical protein
MSPLLGSEGGWETEVGMSNTVGKMSPHLGLKVGGRRRWE